MEKNKGFQIRLNPSEARRAEPPKNVENVDAMGKDIGMGIVQNMIINIMLNITKQGPENTIQNIRKLF